MRNLTEILQDEMNAVYPLHANELLESEWDSQEETALELLLNLPSERE